MGIDFWYYIEWENPDGKLITVNSDKASAYFPTLSNFDAFQVHFPDRGFYKTEMAQILGYPSEAYSDKISEAPDSKIGKYLFFRTLEQLEGIFRSKRICKMTDYSYYKMFRLFLTDLRMDVNKYGLKNMKLIVATDWV